MIWKNALRDQLPPHQEEVVISVKGINYVGTFCAENKHFKIEDDRKSTFFKLAEHDVYWMELKKPNSSSDQTISL